MFEKNREFSKSDLTALLQSPEARALLARLQQLDPNALQAAASKAMQGDAAGAQAALTPLLQDTEVRKLSDTIRNGHGGL